MTVSALRHRIFEILDMSRGFEDSFRGYDRGRNLDEAMAPKEERSPWIFDFSFQTGPQGAQVDKAAYARVYFERTPEETSESGKFREYSVFASQLTARLLLSFDYS